MKGIPPNAAIEVHSVTNGFLVMRPGAMRDAARCPRDEWLVFQSFAELSVWMQQHFTYRNDDVISDIYNRGEDHKSLDSQGAASA